MTITLTFFTESLGACNSSEAGLNYRPSGHGQGWQGHLDEGHGWQGHSDVEEEEAAAIASVVDNLQRELVKH